MSAEELERVVSTLISCLPVSEKSIALHEPTFVGNEWAYVKDCLDTGWVSYLGPYVDQFERQLADYTGVKHAIAIVNGTAALHLALNVVGVRAEDEVILPALTFVATANAVVYCNAEPHFVDSSLNTLGLDPIALRNHLRNIATRRDGATYNRLTGRRIGAVIAVHIYGHPVDLDELVAVCQEFGLPLVEDAAESLGSYYKGVHTGNHGQCSALSFNGNKVITTGGGGAILTNDSELAQKLRHLSTTAKTPHRWEFNHDVIGFNYRLPNVNAAIGCAQMEQIEPRLRNKRELANRYAQAFESSETVSVFREPSFAQSNYWLNVLLLKPGSEHLKEPVLEATHNRKIFTRPTWTLLHRLPMYDECPRAELPVAEDIARRLINVPSSPQLVASEDFAPATLALAGSMPVEATRPRPVQLLGPSK